jgi:hypothetical protein
MRTHTLEVCVDCLSLLANGEVFDGDGNDVTKEHAAAMDREWPDTEITLGRMHSDECLRFSDYCEHTDSDRDGPEPWFSWAQCQGCGSTLGGDREYATAWIRE